MQKLSLQDERRLRLEIPAAERFLEAPTAVARLLGWYGILLLGHTKLLLCLRKSSIAGIALYSTVSLREKDKRSISCTIASIPCLTSLRLGALSLHSILPSGGAFV